MVAIRGYMHCTLRKNSSGLLLNWSALPAIGNPLGDGGSVVIIMKNPILRNSTMLPTHIQVTFYRNLLNTMTSYCSTLMLVLSFLDPMYDYSLPQLRYRKQVRQALRMILVINSGK